MERSARDPAEQAKRDLARVTAALAAAEERPGQQEMTAAIATAIAWEASRVMFFHALLGASACAAVAANGEDARARESAAATTLPVNRMGTG